MNKKQLLSIALLLSVVTGVNANGLGTVATQTAKAVYTQSLSGIGILTREMHEIFQKEAIAAGIKAARQSGEAAARGPISPKLLEEIHASIPSFGTNLPSVIPSTAGNVVKNLAVGEAVKRTGAKVAEGFAKLMAPQEVSTATAVGVAVAPTAGLAGTTAGVNAYITNKAAKAAAEAAAEAAELEAKAAKELAASYFSPERDAQIAGYVNGAYNVVTTPGTVGSAYIGNVAVDKATDYVPFVKDDRFHSKKALRAAGAVAAGYGFHNYATEVPYVGTGIATLAGLGAIYQNLDSIKAAPQAAWNKVKATGSALYNNPWKTGTAVVTGAALGADRYFGTGYAGVAKDAIVAGALTLKDTVVDNPKTSTAIGASSVGLGTAAWYTGWMPSISSWFTSTAKADSTPKVDTAGADAQQAAQALSEAKATTSIARNSNHIILTGTGVKFVNGFNSLSPVAKAQIIKETLNWIDSQGPGEKASMPALKAALNSIK